jgi:hypothetical protein
MRTREFDAKTQQRLTACKLTGTRTLTGTAAMTRTTQENFKITTVPNWIMADYHHWHNETVKKLDIVKTYKRNASM